MKVLGKVIVVTGAGNGVGREITLQLLNKGAKVAAVDISLEGLKETARLAGSTKNLTLHEVNIMDRDMILYLAEEVNNIHGQVDGLINNAGIIQPFIHLNELTTNQIDRVMNVNFNGTLNMIHGFLPKLLKRPEGHIVNVSSMGGFLPVPGQSVYGASKAAVKLLSEGLNSELADTNVNVSVVIPGGIATDIKKNSYENGRVMTQEEKDNKMLLTPQKAAELIIEAMEKKKTTVYIGKDSQVMRALYTISPKLAMALINKVMKENQH